MNEIRIYYKFVEVNPYGTFIQDITYRTVGCIITEDMLIDYDNYRYKVVKVILDLTTGRIVPEFTVELLKVDDNGQ